MRFTSCNVDLRRYKNKLFPSPAVNDNAGSFAVYDIAHGRKTSLTLWTVSDHNHLLQSCVLGVVAVLIFFFIYMPAKLLVISKQASDNAHGRGGSTNETANLTSHRHISATNKICKQFLTRCSSHSKAFTCKRFEQVKLAFGFQPNWKLSRTEAAVLKIYTFTVTTAVCHYFCQPFASRGVS